MSTVNTLGLRMTISGNVLFESIGGNRIGVYKLTVVEGDVLKSSNAMKEFFILIKHLLA
jgi:hypothetical protein